MLRYEQGRYRAGEEERMPSHKFQVGEIVVFRPGRNVPSGAYEVVKQLPETDGEFEYHIKSMNEPHQRVARESELTRA
jgi:hypothetical protein